MPKNKGRGGKNYKKGKHSGPAKRDLLLKQADQGLEYAIASKMLGNGRVLLKCFDEVQRIGNIRGKMKKKVWINPGDLLMCSLREFQNQKCDIILKYTPDQVRQLKGLSQVPMDLQIIEGQIQHGQQGMGIEFIENQEQNQSNSSSQSQSQFNDSDDEYGMLSYGVTGDKRRNQPIDIDNI